MDEELIEQEMKDLVARIIKDVNEEKQLKFDLNKKKMDETESELVKTFNESQMALYKEYCKKREDFYKSANEIYVKMFR